MQSFASDPAKTPNVVRLLTARAVCNATSHKSLIKRVYLTGLNAVSQSSTSSSVGYLLSHLRSSRWAQLRICFSSESSPPESLQVLSDLGYMIISLRDPTGTKFTCRKPLKLRKKQAGTGLHLREKVNLAVFGSVDGPTTQRPQSAENSKHRGFPTTIVSSDHYTMRSFDGETEVFHKQHSILQR